MAERKTYSNEQILAWGQRMADGEWPTIDAGAAALGIAESQLRHYLGLYRVSQGEDWRQVPGLRPDYRQKRELGLDPAQRMPRGKTALARAKDAARHRAKRAAAKLEPTAPNGNGSDVVPFTDPHQIIAGQAQRIAELEAQLDQAMHEAHTLQKIIMVLGDKL
jgi:hypothetical protein